MMSLSYFRGCAIGLAAAAPIGGVSILCIRRTFAEGWLCGVVSGLGVATADACYSFIAGTGAGLIVPFLEQHHYWLRVSAGVLLCAIACKIALTLPAIQPTPLQGRKLLDRYGSMFLVTLADPVPIFLSMVILSGINTTSSVHAGVLSLGVFSGSLLWWLLLCSVCELLRSQLKQVFGETSRSIVHPAAIKWLNRVAGAALFGCGLVVISG